MIFNSAKMVALREKYRNLPNYEVPDIVFLDRYDGYQGERILLEKLYKSVSTNKQNGWLGSLINEDEEQHVGAWFEIMLYSWLLNSFDVLVEPVIHGNFPDFVINTPEHQLAIEAKAFLITPEERTKKQKFDRIYSALSSIQKPFLIILEINQLGGKIIINEFVDRVNSWLDSDTAGIFTYQDTLGNILQLKAKKIPSVGKVKVLSTDMLFVNPNVLKKPLSKKAEQHKILRNSGFPYVIAIFLEPSHLTAEIVSEAWFGKTVIVLKQDTDKVVEEKVDESGIQFYKSTVLQEDESGIQFFVSTVQHKSVTGTLVFKARHDEVAKTRYLQSWYIQNPYANVPVDPYIFPVESRYVVVGQDDVNYEMKWVK